ncbi:hypothetical protein HYALB_00006091 [Hymenoscyphus albidus]|uniref:Uncharacterized protein n=1 Tax=Hymenoscyphus albidus TaxID=595503 RepID=A0A9N9LXZ9_9HELO|nr:hypothetical protein HYALB_00006091 [Hymenoscyphus albidus]
MLLTQTNTNWLRMPPRERGSSLEAPKGVQGVGTTLLKKHKMLPHPREPRVPIQPMTPATKPRRLVVDTAVGTGSETSSPPTLKHASRRINSLPPTPPTHSRQSSSNSASIRQDAASSRNSSNVPSVPTTPTNQRSPPTPDVTPPRHMPLSFRPPIFDRYPSSRAESFKTALESQDSSEEEASTVRPAIPSTRTSALEVPQLPKLQHRRKEIGLGLGLESDNEGTTTPRPRVGTPRRESHVFDGEWISEPSEVEREWDDNLMRNVTVRKRPMRNFQMFTNDNMDEVYEDDIITPTQATKIVRNFPLQERIDRHRQQRDTKNRSVSDQFAQRAPRVQMDSPTTPDVRRFSAVSTRSVSSTVVEAMVVDGPPGRRKTLRHTKKQIGLRDMSSDQSTIPSAPTSVISMEQTHRLHHSNGRLLQHQSQISTRTVSSTASGKARRQVLKRGGIPVVVIPDRHSSTKSAKTPSLRSTSSRRTKRSMSLSSAPLSNSSRFNEPGYFDTLPPRKRNYSESAGSDSVRTIDFPPDIPARRSSLSAPTSRNTSRAGSLTAESLKAHNMIQARKAEHVVAKHVQSPSVESPNDVGIYSPRANVDHNGDPFFGKRCSTQVTPFSQVSYETAGTAAEVSEALAVSIFPHQNKSLLVVQHSSSDSSPPASRDASGSQEPRSTMRLSIKPTSGPVTPPQPRHPMDEVDSPLRNPRAPPAPPAIKFIPATPAAVTPGHEEERQLGFEFIPQPCPSDERPKRGPSLIRKLSTRRNSEPAVDKNPGFIKRTLSLSNRTKRQDESTQTSKGVANLSTLYPTVDDKPADGTKLHPFWRPSHFWDDLEDEGFADDELGGGYPIVDNRPTPKRSISGKLKRTFAILPLEDEPSHRSHSQDRRTMRKSTSGNLCVVKQRSNSSLRRDRNKRRQYAQVPPGTFGHGFKEGNGGRVHTIPGIGIRVEYVGWSALKERMTEKRRQQRSEKLRSSISNPREVRSGVDDVLRRRKQR